MAGKAWLLEVAGLPQEPGEHSRKAVEQRTTLRSPEEYEQDDDEENVSVRTLKEN